MATNSESSFTVKVLKEAGYEEAILGITLSYGSTIERTKLIAAGLAHKQGGHNKFLESMMVWVDINAPRYWWSQMDTYRVATKQSESTMHTILKRDLVVEDFAVAPTVETMDNLNALRRVGALETLKALLPEGFLQRRIVCCSYKTLQNIIAQRKTHKLREWQSFCSLVVEQAEHAEFLVKTETIP